MALTDGINLIHEDDAWLVVTGVVEHLSDQPSTLTDVFIHDRAGHHLQHFQTSDSQVLGQKTIQHGSLI